MCYTTALAFPADDDAAFLEFAQIVIGDLSRWSRVRDQSVGTACDYMCVDAAGKHWSVELKQDAAAVRTGRIFVEYMQTFDGWATQRSSGVRLAVKQAELFVIFTAVRGRPCFFYGTPDDWIDKCLSKGCESRDTRRGANGNKDGHVARGWVIRPDDVVSDEDVFVCL